MDKQGFYALLFHGLYEPSQKDELKHPFLYVSTEEFEKVICTFKDQGFTFLSENDILSGSFSGWKNIVLTFDDGYFNNTYALPILERHDVPALFFLAMDQIQNQKLFWWDAYLNGNQNKESFDVLYEKFQDFKLKRQEDIQNDIISNYGEDGLHSHSEVLRPLTIEEAKAFAQHPNVTIGAHSRYHDNLTLLTHDELIQNLEHSKSFLEDLCDQTIKTISYPFGFFNDEVVRVSENSEYSLGFTTISGFNDVQNLKDTKSKLKFKRDVFPIPKDDRSVVDQVQEFIDKVSLENEENLHSNV